MRGTYVRVYVCACVWAYACACVRACVRVCVCVCVCARARAGGLPIEAHIVDAQSLSRWVSAGVSARVMCDG